MLGVEATPSCCHDPNPARMNEPRPRRTGRESRRENRGVASQPGLLGEGLGPSWGVVSGGEVQVRLDALEERLPCGGGPTAARLPRAGGEGAVGLTGLLLEGPA